MSDMSQSFYSIRERFEASTAQNQTLASGKSQKPAAPSRTRVQTTNPAFRVPLPCVVAFPKQKNPPPSPVIRSESPVRTFIREVRPEKVNFLSELINEESRSLRVAPKVPEKPKAVLCKNTTNREQSISSTSVRPTTLVKPAQEYRLPNTLNSPLPSPKILSQSSPQRSLSVNRLREKFEQTRTEVPITTKSSTKDRTSPHLNQDHGDDKGEGPRLPPNKTRQTTYPRHYAPPIENVYDDPVYHGSNEAAKSNSQHLQSPKSEDGEIYMNIPNCRLQMFSPSPAPPLPRRKPVYTNLESSERKAYEFNTLPRNFKSVSFEDLLDRKSDLQSSSNDSFLNYDSDFDDDDEDCEVFGDTTATQSDGGILGKHFALNLSGLLSAPRQRFSYAAPQTRPELKSTMSFSHKCHERTLIRNKDTPDDSEKYDKQLQNITDELINTERNFVESLMIDFDKFDQMFQRRDIPRGLKDKQGILFGNIAEIIRFHRDTVLPMFEKNQKDLSSLFDKFSVLLDDHRFYEYVIFATNNKNALRIVDDFQPYFQHFQTQINDPLGIQNFLLLPIQRLPRYELFLKDFMKTLFDACSHSSKYFTQKTQVKALCDLEKKLKNFVNLVNEANVVCDIIGWTNLNLFNRENRFRKVLDDLFVYDYDLQQGYGGKVFIFDKFMIYTEVMGDSLIYRGCYDPSRGIDLIAEEKAFKMAHRRVQVCNFHSETAAHNQYCLSYIEDMIQSNRMNGCDQRGYGSNSSSGNMSTLLEEEEC